jgi:hypothetical protein
MIPILYWMLECRKCGARRVVHDCYQEFTGGKDADILWGGYGGLSQPDRYRCLKGCWGAMRAIGSVWSPNDESTWPHEPHKPEQMSNDQCEEWKRLIRGDAKLGLWARLVYQRNRPIRFVLAALKIAAIVFALAAVRSAETWTSVQSGP